MKPQAADVPADTPESGVCGLAQPLDAYRKYLRAIRHRDLPALMRVLSARASRQLIESVGTTDFGAFFQIWCDSQREPIMVTACRIDKDSATIEVRGWNSTGRIGLTRNEASWQVDSETYKPQRLAAGQASAPPSESDGPRLE